MRNKILLAATIVLIISLAVAVYFIFDYSAQIKDLNVDKSKLKSDLSDAEDDNSKLKSDLSDAEDEISDLTGSISKLQLDYDKLTSFTYCGDDLNPLTYVDYSSHSEMSEALTNWVDEMWGGVLSTEWYYFWDEGMAVMHVIETSYAYDFFIVFFDNPEFGAKNGVFIVSHQCWLDIEE